MDDDDERSYFSLRSNTRHTQEKKKKTKENLFETSFEMFATSLKHVRFRTRLFKSTKKTAQ